MCGLRTRLRTDVDPKQFLSPSNCHREAYRLAAAAEVIPYFSSTTAEFYTADPVKQRVLALSCLQSAATNQQVTVSGHSLA